MSPTRRTSGNHAASIRYRRRWMFIGSGSLWYRRVIDRPAGHAGLWDSWATVWGNTVESGRTVAETFAVQPLGNQPLIGIGFPCLFPSQKTFAR
jgi:hypothetical protein